MLQDGYFVWLFAAAIVTFGSCSIENRATGIGVLSGESKTITVKRGGDFQSALDRAAPGDTILLEAGATFKGAFKLPNKQGSEFITIRSSAPDSQLPKAGERIDPARFASALPKVESDVRGEPAIMASGGAHHYRFIGVEFGPTPAGLYNIIQLGTGEERKIDDLPHHIEFDRVYVHGDPSIGQRRGIAANGRFVIIKNSYISDIKLKGDESQAVAVWATDGPVEITNNYLEAAGENILFGGAGSYLKLVPSNCVVKGNHLNKPTEWRNQGWVVKNLFEVKNGSRIKVTNNNMTNNWGMAQDGFAVLFTTRADNGNASIVEDVEFENNTVRNSACAVNVLGEEGGGGHRLTIRNNLFANINGHDWNGAGHFLKSSDWDGLTIQNNTIIQTGSITSAYGKPVTDFVFRDNIVFNNEYGFFGDNLGSGSKAIDTYFPNSSISNNVIIGGDPSQYRGKNFTVNSSDKVGFVDAVNGNFRLRGESPYINKGSGGKPIGANIAAMSGPTS
jgi:hypothetical protein